MIVRRRRSPLGFSRVTVSRSGLGHKRTIAGDGPVTDLERTIQVVGSVIAPVTVFAALMFYFGWIRTNALFQYFGVDAAVLGFSTQDYMLRGVEGFYHPLGMLLVVGLVGLWLHSLVSRRLTLRRRAKRLQLTVIVLGLVGLALFSMGVAGVVEPSLFGRYILMAPICLGFGAAIGAYGRWLWQRLQDVHTSGPLQPRWAGIANLILVSLLVTLSLFWAVSEYAAAIGRGRAEALARGLMGRPGVTVFSVDRLFLQGPGIIEIQLPDDPYAGYRYRYDGMRLLTESDGRLFLLPESWIPARTSTVVLDRNKIRVEFVPSSGA